MIDLINLSKVKTKFFENELLARVFMTKLTYKAIKRGYAVNYKIGSNYKKITYNLIEKTTYPLNSSTQLKTAWSPRPKKSGVFFISKYYIYNL